MALTHPIGLDEPDETSAAQVPAEATGHVTPVMAQYVEIKAANPDCLLFYRMGDFYELFFEDAEVASRALGIVLTKRSKHHGQDIPMCGVPIARSDEYLHRLIALGHRVAVCEQLEDPAEAKKRGAKSVVKRDVVRLITPGTLTEDSLLEARRNNYLLAVARARLSSVGEETRFALAWIDISTAEFRICECDRIDPADVAQELVAEPLAARGTPHQPGDVDEFELGRHDLRRFAEPRADLEPLVGYRHPADIGLDRAEGIVRRLGRGGLGQRVEERRLADIGQADDTAFETHGGNSGETVWRLLCRSRSSPVNPSVLGKLPRRSVQSRSLSYRQ